MSDNFRRTPDGFLAYMMRKLILTLGFDSTKLKQRIERYIRANNVTNDSTKHHIRINIFNEITRDRMSIKVFFKTLAILRIKKVKFSIIVTNEVNQDIVISEEFDLVHTED